MTKKFFLQKCYFFYSVRFINVWVDKKRYFTSNLLIGNPLGAFKDIQISAKSVGCTHHLKFSE